MELGLNLDQEIDREFLVRHKGEQLPFEMQKILKGFGDQSLSRIVAGGEGRIEYDDVVPERVYRAFKRPSILIQGNDFDPSGSETWDGILSKHKPALKSAIPAVGRVEMKNHEMLGWAGTGFLLENEIIVTNKHVADLFVEFDGGEFKWKKNPSGRIIGGRIDFKEEYQQPDEIEFNFTEIMHVESINGLDLAFFRCPEASSVATPMQLECNVRDDLLVAVIGYPWKDSRVSPQIEAILKRIFKNIYDVKRLSPGKIVGQTNDILHHDCSTLGGNSGSAVVDIETGRVVGIHFEGDTRHNNAVCARSIAEILSRL